MGLKPVISRFSIINSGEMQTDYPLMTTILGLAVIKSRAWNMSVIFRHVNTYSIGIKNTLYITIYRNSNTFITRRIINI